MSESKSPDSAGPSQITLSPVGCVVVAVIMFGLVFGDKWIPQAYQYAESHVLSLRR